jgi:eukaryotic-like serine/threonine-protein kinase
MDRMLARFRSLPWSMVETTWPVFWFDTMIGAIDMPVANGTLLGPYEIEGPLGAGGMGEVYRARDKRLGRHVAVKVLSATFAGDRDRLRRFEREARAVAALNHPNILAIHDVGTQPDAAPYLVSELLEGESLRQRLQKGPLSARKAIDYGIQIAQGLSAAHDKGIAHRDLKPENLFLTKDGLVKILDFGVATLPEVADGAETVEARAATMPGTVLGTVGYMSPEQVRGDAADHRSDVFSLGAVLYEMFTGRRAFIRPSAVETMNAILKEEPPALPSDAEQVPSGVQRILDHCLEKEPEQRFQSARDLGVRAQRAFRSIERPSYGDRSFADNSTRALAGSRDPIGDRHRHLRCRPAARRQSHPA